MSGRFQQKHERCSKAILIQIKSLYYILNAQVHNNVSNIKTGTDNPCKDISTEGYN